MCYLSRGARVGSKRQYQVEAWLGFSQGGPACEFFAARDRDTGAAVLVKAFPEDGSVGASDAAFDREARRIAELGHPALAPLVDFGRFDTPWGESLRYVVEAALAGRNLDQVLAARPPAAEVEPLVRPLADGCAYLRDRDAGVDVPAPEVFEQPEGGVRFGVFGLPRIPADQLPAALQKVRARYPDLHVA